MLEVISVDENKQDEMMTVPPTTQNKGRLVLCAEGERLYGLYCIMTDDDELCFTQQMSDAWKAWIEHKNSCDRCGYI